MAWLNCFLLIYSFFSAPFSNFLFLSSFPFQNNMRLLLFRHAPSYIVSIPFHSIPFCAFYRLFCRLKTHFHIQLVSTLIILHFFFVSLSLVPHFESGYDFNYRLRVWSIKIMTQFICVVTLLVENIVRFFRVR